MINCLRYISSSILIPLVLFRRLLFAFLHYLHHTQLLLYIHPHPIRKVPLYPEPIVISIPLPHNQHIIQNKPQTPHEPIETYTSLRQHRLLPLNLQIPQGVVRPGGDDRLRRPRSKPAGYKRAIVDAIVLLDDRRDTVRPPRRIDRMADMYGAIHQRGYIALVDGAGGISWLYGDHQPGVAETGFELELALDVHGDREESGIGAGAARSLVDECEDEVVDCDFCFAPSGFGEPLVDLLLRDVDGSVDSARGAVHEVPESLARCASEPGEPAGVEGFVVQPCYLLAFVPY